MMTISSIFLILFLLVATIDGIYFHLWKYKLFARAESLYEHKLHTIRAFLFIPIVFFLFYADFGGLALWTGIFFILLDLAVEMFDVFAENDSRASMGGLTSLEYAAHVAATTFRVAAVSFALAAKPISAWDFSSPLILGQFSSLISMNAVNTMFGNLLVVILHLLLMSKNFRSLPIFKCCQAS
ncbi:MAG TPA: hypothetical protein PKE69_10155 [Pyrinomonadaceae bacterium]|nr:hypothetical protein [Pyrinomonadaceae bacterium]